MPSAPTAVLLGDLNMLRCFSGTDVPVIVVSTDPAAVVLRSRHARQTALIAPFSQTEQALADLERIARTCSKTPVLFYGNDEQLLFVSRNRTRLARSYRFLLPDDGLLEALVDKRRFGRFARGCGLPVPSQVGSSEVPGPDAALAQLRLPCVIKPDVHIGWFSHGDLHREGPRKAFLVTTPAELRTRWKEVSAHVKDFVIQEYIPGGEDQVYSFHAYVRADGTVNGWFVGKKVRTFPRSAGISTYLELAIEPRVAALGFEIVRRSGVVGPIKLDIKRNPTTDTFHLLEINARFNLWHRLGTAAGINLPLIAYADLTGVAHRAPTAGYATNVRWLAFGDDLRSFLRSYRPAGELGWGGWLASLRGRIVHDIFAWDDPMPLVATVLNYSKALTRRLVGATAPAPAREAAPLVPRLVSATT